MSTLAAPLTDGTEPAIMPEDMGADVEELAAALDLLPRPPLDLVTPDPSPEAYRSILQSLLPHLPRTLAWEAARDAPRLIVAFFDGRMRGIWNQPDGTPYMAVHWEPEAFRKAIGAHTFYSGLLPGGEGEANTLALAESPEVRLVTLYLPPCRRTLRLSQQDGAEIGLREYTIPCPPLLFQVRLEARRQRFNLWAVARRPRHEREPVHAAPFFNTHESSGVCEGSVKFPDASTPEGVLAAAELFFSSVFTPAYPNGKSRRHRTLLALWKSLVRKRSYPLDDLVPTSTVGAIIKGVERWIS